MAIKSSALEDQKTGVNIQTEGHTLTPPSGQNGPEDIEAFGSTPSHFTIPVSSEGTNTWPPETWYCLEIQVICTKDGGTTPPPPHTWEMLVVEDMVQDGKSGLTEAVVTGPSQAILFYGWQLLGEGLSLGKTWDTMFTLSGAIYWVGKHAQLNANLVSLGEDWQLITQGVTKWCNKPRGPGHPCSIPPASAPFNFHNQNQFPWAVRPSTPVEWRGDPSVTLGHHTRTEAKHYRKTEAKGDENYGQTHPCCLCCHQIVGFRVIEVQHQLLHQCHQGLIDLEVPGVHTEANDTTGSLEATWKSTCQSSSMRTWKTLSPTKVGVGT